MATLSLQSSNDSEGRRECDTTTMTDVSGSQEEEAGSERGSKSVGVLEGRNNHQSHEAATSQERDSTFSFASVVSAVSSSSALMTREGSGKNKNSTSSSSASGVKSNTTTSNSSPSSSKGNCDSTIATTTSSLTSSTPTLISSQNKRSSREGRGSNESNRMSGGSSPSPASSPQPTVLIRETPSPSSLASIASTSSGTKVIGWKTAKNFSKTLSSIEVAAGGAAAGTSVVHHRIPATTTSASLSVSTSIHKHPQQYTSSSRPAAIRIQMMEPVGPSAYSLSLQAQRTPSEQWKLLKNRLMRKKSTEETVNPFSPDVIEKMRQSLKPPVPPVIISSSTPASSSRSHQHHHHVSTSSGGSPVSSSGDDGGIVFRTNELKTLLRGSIERGDYHHSTERSNSAVGNEIMIPSSNRSSNRSSFDTTSEGDNSDKSNMIPAAPSDKKFGISDATASLLLDKNKKCSSSGNNNTTRKTTETSSSSYLEKEDMSESPPEEAASSQVKWDEVSLDFFSSFSASWQLEHDFSLLSLCFSCSVSICQNHDSISRDDNIHRFSLLWYFFVVWTEDWCTQTHAHLFTH